jgi:glycosyltransferase involved in cell wall biosynthesis
VPAIPIAYAEELTIPLRGAGLKNRIKRWLLRRAYPGAAGVVSVCGFTRDVLVSVGVPADRIEIIVPMIGEAKIAKAPAPRGKPGRRILTVGRLVRRKGFDFLIEAVARLRSEMPDIRLTIVGDGPEQPKLAALTAAHGLESNVALAGRLSDEELRRAYEQTDVFVLACVVLENGDCEGTPTVFIEASALGIPVIAGTGGGTDGAVEEGRNGFLVDCRNVEQLAETIRLVLCDEDLARRLGAGGIEKVASDHLPSVAARRFEIFMSRLLREMQPGRRRAIRV